MTAQVNGQVSAQIAPQVGDVLAVAKQVVSAQALRRAGGLEDRVRFLPSQFPPPLERGRLERAIPDEPRSRI